MNLCAFCGPTKAEMSVEDIFPRWLSKYFRQTFRHRTFTQYDVVHGVRSTHQEIHQRIKVDAPVVCKPCNNDWMSYLEKSVKLTMVDLITHPNRPRPISELEAFALALWISQKSMVLDYLCFQQRRQRRLFYTPQQRTAMRDNYELPAHTSVWLTRIQKRERVCGDLQHLYYPQFRANVALRDVKAAITTIAMNELTIQVCTLRGRKRGAHIPASFPFNINPTPGTWDDYSIELWPNNTIFDWPPPRMFRKGSFKFVAYRVAGIPGDTGGTTFL